MTTKKEKVITLLEAGESTAYIAAKVKTSKQYVYSLRSEMRKNNKKAKPKQENSEVAELKAQIAALKSKLPKVDAYNVWMADCHYCNNPCQFDGMPPTAGEMFVCPSCDEYNIVEDVGV